MKFSHSKLFAWLGYTLLLSLVFCFAAFKIDDPDTMQYLASGRNIAQNGFSQSCVFNYSNSTCQTVYAEWLTSLVVYGVHQAWGFAGLTVLQVALVLTTFILILWYHGRERVSMVSSILILTLVAFVAMERFMLRADLFALPLAVGMYILLYYVIPVSEPESNPSPQPLPRKGEGREGVKEINYEFGSRDPEAQPINGHATGHRKLGMTYGYIKRYRHWIIILTIQLLWTNTHGSFPLGWAIIGAFLVAGIIKYFWRRLKRKQPQELRPVIKFLSIIFIAAIIVSLISPYGLKAFVWPFQFYFGPAEFHSQAEFKSPFAPTDFVRSAVFAYELLSAIVVLALLFARKKLRLVDFFILAGFFILSLQSQRYMALFAVFAGLILPRYLDAIALFMKQRLLKHRFTDNRAFGLSIVVFLIFSVFIIHSDYSLATNKFYIADLRLRRFGFGVSEITYPHTAVKFIAEHGLRGNMFNDYGSGTFVNWKLYPEHRSFIDGHTYTLSLLQEYKKITDGSVSPEGAVVKYGINYFLLGYVPGDTLDLITRLYKDSRWALVYEDETAVIFAANTEANKSLISQYKVDFVQNRNFNLDVLSTFKDSANFSTGFASRGGLLATLELWELAKADLEKAVSFDPNNFIAQVNLGKVYFKLGDTAAAERAYKAALAIENGFAPAHYNLGVYYASQQNWELAARELQETLVLNSEYPHAHYNLGVVYESLGDKDKAGREYQKELK